MEIGKIPESILKRAVFRQIHTKRDEVLVGAGVGEDCAVMQLAPDEVFVLSTDPITGTEKDMGTLALQITANDLASAGAEPVGVLLTVLLPPSADEPLIRRLMQEVECACEKLHIQVMGGHTEVTAVVNQPVISVTGVGKAKKDRLITTGGAHVGDDVIVTKWIGIEGTSIIAKEKEEELKQHFTGSFVDQAKAFDQYLSVVPEAMVAVAHGVTAMHDVTEGGIYGALWELAEASGVGLEIDLKAIPIRQETVEVCEQFHLNPYQLISSGSMLMAAPDGLGLVQALKKAGIPASIVGRCVEGKAKKIVNGEDTAYLERPKTDELYKIYESGNREMREKILTYIERNSRVDLKDLAIMLGPDEAAVANEIADMEKEGVICGYHTLIDWDKTSSEKVTALIEVKVTPQRGLGFDKIAERIYNYPEVDCVYLISGGFDFMVMIEGKTMRGVAQFVSEKLSTQESVLSTATHFILKKYKDHGSVMVNPSKDERMLVTP